MGLIEVITLSGIMIALAAMPSTSVALVVTRSAMLGTGNGIAVAAGIVLADLVFLLLAIFGLTLVAQSLGSLFIIVKYIGALYLTWLGYTLLTSRPGAEESTIKSTGSGSLIASLFAGFVLTLGDIKAIFFYASLLPVFIDLTTLQTSDIAIVICITILGVGGVKVLYALLASRIASAVRNPRFANASRKTAGGLMIGAGSYLIVKN